MVRTEAVAEHSKAKGILFWRCREDEQFEDGCMSCTSRAVGGMRAIEEEGKEAAEIRGKHDRGKVPAWFLLS